MSEVPEVFDVFEKKLAQVLSFTLVTHPNSTKKAVEELLTYFSSVVERASKAESRIAELEAEVTKCHELQDSYCDRPIEDALRAERDRAREMVTRLIETGRLLCDYAILVSLDHPMGDGRMALNDKSAWDALVTEWQMERER